MTHEPRVQLRFLYDLPTAPQRLQLELRGLHVSASPVDGDLQRAGAYLQGVGISVRIDPVGALVFALGDLHLLESLPGRVVLLPDPRIGTLLTLLQAADEGVNVVMTVDSPGTLNLNWPEGAIERNESFPLAAAAALLEIGVPLAASSSTWEAVERASVLPVVRARARVNLDGFVEIVTPVPQQIGALDVPGLFHLDDSRFGVPLASTAALDRVPGLVWDGPLPSRATVTAPPLSTLSPSWREALTGFMSEVSLRHGRVLTGSSHAQRSLLAACAAALCDASPLLVLTPASHLWAWRIHLAQLDAVLGEIAGPAVRLLSYESLPATSAVSTLADGPAGAVVFDEPLSALHRDPSLSARLRIFDGSVDGLRLTLTGTLPEDPRQLALLLSLARPVEFDATVPLASRYPLPAEQRFRQHAAIYLAAAPAAAPTPRWVSAETEIVSPDPTLLTALHRLDDLAPDRHRSRRERVDMLRDWFSGGPDGFVGPKIARTLTLVERSLRAERPVTVLTSRTRTRDRLEVLLGRRAAALCTVIHVASGTFATLENGADAVIVDSDVSLSAGWDATATSPPSGPQAVTRLHLDHPFEDCLARLQHGHPSMETTTGDVDVLLAALRTP